VSAYYNENDPKTAAWLRELIRQGLIADGEVDTRSIVDVQPADLTGFAQCHFFAGIGGWSYALRLAGWPDDRECWTGSCPCQPFSSAGTQAGGADARDLWPAWFRLIRERRPVVVFGEQVESAIAHGWLDRLCDDLEGEGYAVGPGGVPAAGVGAFHIRHRLWFVADANGRQSSDGDVQRGGRHDKQPKDAAVMHVGHAGRSGLEERDRHGRIQPGALGAHPRQGTERAGDLSHVAVTDERGRQVADVSVRPAGQGKAAAIERGTDFWGTADWIPCADGKWRPVEPGTFPLAHGLPARVGRLRGYGNAIVPQVAAEVISAYMEIAE
jgi:DNA (cytosine-5)-methyltransferase 1